MPPTIERRVIGPAEAKALLGNSATNRAVLKWRVEKYARDMTNGHWHENGETIKLDEQGRLIDGQHRLNAIVSSKTFQPFVVVLGVSEEGRKTIDIGAKRRFADILAIEGYQRTNLLAGMVRVARLLDLFPGHGTEGSIGVDKRASEEELYQYLLDHPDINDSVLTAGRAGDAVRIAPSTAGAVHYVGSRKDPQAAEAFWYGVISGVELQETDAAFRLRQVMFDDMKRHQRDRMPPNMVLAVTIKAWNYHLYMKPIKLLRWTRAESFPRMNVNPG